eukprot:6267047-Amphidinium_carterae.1
MPTSCSATKSELKSTRPSSLEERQPTFRDEKTTWPPLIQSSASGLNFGFRMTSTCQASRAEMACRTRHTSSRCPVVLIGMLVTL